MSGMDQKLSIEQKQVLKINPVQLQKLEILQMNSQELEERIREELIENPALEMSEDMDDTWEDSDSEATDTGTDQLYDNREMPYDYYDDHDYWDNGSFTSSVSSAQNTDEAISFESFYRTEEILTEFLLKQLWSVRCSDAVKRAAGYIIYSLDSDGRLDTKLEEIAVAANCEPAEAEEALNIVQGLEPTGVGARSIEECLCLQVDNGNELAEDVKRAITGHLSEIASGNIRSASKKMNIPTETMIRIIEIIRNLDPRPCSRFSDNLPVQYLSPDVYLELTDGEIEVCLAAKHPRLILSAYYLQMLRTSEDSSVTDYLKERVESATRLIQNIKQRNSTILNVTRTIMRHQRAFLEQGARAMAPLTMQMIADELDISVSTVSRAVNGKSVYFMGNTYPIKQFFSSEVSGMAKASLVDRINAMISGEDPQHPLSDQMIADKLGREGIEISRRTVAKYREEAGILPTYMRKKR